VRSPVSPHSLVFHGTAAPEAGIVPVDVSGLKAGQVIPVTVTMPDRRNGADASSTSTCQVTA
jgi:hypothetical protein